MNDRIKELVISTGIYDSLCDPYDKHNTGDSSGSVMDDLEKFAQLIIEECGVALSPMLRDMISRGQACDIIKKHFGVE